AVLSLPIPTLPLQAGGCVLVAAAGIRVVLAEGRTASQQHLFQQRLGLPILHLAEQRVRLSLPGHGRCIVAPDRLVPAQNASVRFPPPAGVHGLVVVGPLHTTPQPLQFLGNLERLIELAALVERLPALVQLGGLPLVLSFQQPLPRRRRHRWRLRRLLCR